MVDESSSSQVVGVSSGDTADTITVQLVGDLAALASADKIIYLPPGMDARYPMGFAGKILSVTENADGSKSILVDSVTYADVFEETESSLQDIVLDADNFIWA